MLRLDDNRTGLRHEPLARARGRPPDHRRSAWPRSPRARHDSPYRRRCADATQSLERGGRLCATGLACVAVSTSAGAMGQGERRRPIRAWARDDANLCAHNSLCAGVRMRKHSYMRPCAYACPAVINDPNLGSSMLFASREPVMRRPSPCAIFVAGRAASPRCAR